MHFVIARRAAAAAALAGVVLLVIAEFTTLFEVTVGSLEVVKRSTTGGENHGYALLVVALAATVMTALALRGARPPALALLALGVAALGVALAIDLPDARATGQLPEAVFFEQARARPGPGLYLEASGGVLLVVGGLALAFTAAPRADAARRAAR